MTNKPLPEPPKLTQEDIEAFRKAYEQDWGKKLSEGEAVVMAGKLLKLYRGLVKLKSPAVEPPKTPPDDKEPEQPSLF